MNLRELIGTRISISLRSLALFRIFLGLIIIVEVLLRFRNLNVFYTTQGIAPVSIIRDTGFAGEYIFGSPILVSLVFCLTMLFSILMTIGYKTKTSMIFTFILLFLVDTINPYTISIADTVLRFLVLWGIFLPVNNRWSIDSIQLNGSDNNFKIVTKLASYLILFQVFSIYFMNGIQKSMHHESWMNGDAIISILYFEKVTLPTTNYLIELPDLIIQLMGIYWYMMLIIGSILLLLTKERKRYIIATGFLIIHVSFIFTVKIGGFSVISIAGLFLFYQEQFWTDLESVTPAKIETLYEEFRTKGIKISEGIRDFENSLSIDFRYKQELKDLIIEYISMIGIIILVLSLISLHISVIGLTSERIIDQEEHQERLNLMDALSIQPSWGFFTKQMYETDYLIIGSELDDGSKKLILQDDSEFSLDRPYNGELQKQFSTYRHRFYMENVVRSIKNTDSDAFTESLSKYYCDKDKSRSTIEIYLISENYNSNTIDDPQMYDRNIDLEYEYSC